MSADEGGILGNLPRSRPGTRSEKRADSRTPKPSPAGPARKGSSAGAGGRAREADPVGDVLRSAAGVALAGLRVADGVTRELLRRVPRP
jgi:hypothetical protein